MSVSSDNIPDEIVTLVSSDNKEFIIPKSRACLSNQIKVILEADIGEEQKSKRLEFKTINSELMQVAIEFMEYRYKNEHENLSPDKIPEFEPLDKLDSKKPDDKAKIEEFFKMAQFLEL
jgi:hypothetical protein